jgi:hypothetical protein
VKLCCVGAGVPSTLVSLRAPNVSSSGWFAEVQRRGPLTPDSPEATTAWPTTPPLQVLARLAGAASKDVFGPSAEALGWRGVDMVEAECALAR